MRGIMKSNRWLLLALLGLLVIGVRRGVRRGRRGRERRGLLRRGPRRWLQRGGACRERRGGGRRRQADARGLLHAAGGLRRAHPGLPADAGRQGHDLQAVLRRLGRPEPRGRRRPAGRRRGLLAGARHRHAWSRPASSPDWNAGRDKGMVTDSVVVFVVRKGNPKGIKTWDDLVKPGVEVITPEPVHLRRRPLERDGGLRRADQGRARPRTQAQAYLDKLFTERAGAGQERPRRAADLRRRQGRRHDRLRERGDHRPAEGRGRSTTSSPTQTILIENPVAVISDSRSTPTAAKAFVDFLRTPRGRRRSSPSKGYRPVVTDGAARVADSSRRRSGLFTIDDLGGWPRSTTSFFDKDNGIVAKIEQELGVATAKLARRRGSAARRVPRAPAARAARRARAGSAAGGVAALPRLIVPVPLAAVVCAAQPRAGRRRLLGRGDRPRRRSRRSADAVASLIVVAINAVFGTLIAWVLVRDDFRGKSDRQRHHRPAVRAADDRRGPRAAGAVRPVQPARRRRRLHPHGHRAGAPLRDAAVRRARRCSPC